MVYKNVKILDICSVNSVKYLLEKKICIYDIDIFCLYFIIKYGFYICRCIIVLCRRSFDSVNKNEFIMDVFSLCM